MGGGEAGSEGSRVLAGDIGGSGAVVVIRGGDMFCSLMA